MNSKGDGLRRQDESDTVDASKNLGELMLRYQRADADAARELIETASPLLFRYLLGQIRDRSRAEDVLQDVWLRIHRARHTYRPGEPVMPWLYAIARHVRVDSYRKQRRIDARETATEVLPEPEASWMPEQNQKNTPSFEALLAILPEGQREVIKLLKAEDLSLEEVARVTASTVGAVKQKAHRAYERLRTLLTQEAARTEGKEARAPR